MHNQIKMIYERIGDEYSRQIYLNRLLYSLTDDKQYMLNNVRLTVGDEFYARLFESDSTAVIFGAGYWGQEFFRQYGMFRKIECYVDNKISGTYQGIPVISFKQYLKKYKDADIIISAKYAHKEMYQQLIDGGIEEERIINFGKKIYELMRIQYFDLPQLKPEEEGECFVDAGCFDGMSSVAFAAWCEKKYRHIWAFEPDARQQEICKNNLEKAGLRYEVIPKGLWNEAGELGFVLEDLRSSSQVNPNGEDRIEVCKLEDAVRDKVTFIKMDIEGSEYNALLGSRGIIERDAPKLAISIYHKPQDIWEIPALICKMNPNYKFYFRHYSLDWTETVLYAIAEGAGRT